MRNENYVYSLNTLLGTCLRDNTSQHSIKRVKMIEARTTTDHKKMNTKYIASVLHGWHGGTGCLHFSLHEYAGVL